jgi:hypothetical protein
VSSRENKTLPQDTSIATLRRCVAEVESSTSIDHDAKLSSARLHVWSEYVAFYFALDGDIGWLRPLSSECAPNNPPHGSSCKASASSSERRGERRKHPWQAIWQSHSCWAYAMRLASQRLDKDDKSLQAHAEPCTRFVSSNSILWRNCKSELQAKRLACSPSCIVAHANGRAALVMT